MTRRVHPHTDRNADLNRSPRSSFPWLTAAPGSHTGAPKPTRYLGAAVGRPSAHHASEKKEGPFWGGSCWLGSPFLGDWGGVGRAGAGAGRGGPLASGRDSSQQGALPPRAGTPPCAPVPTWPGTPGQLPADLISELPQLLEMEIRGKSLFITL